MHLKEKHRSKSGLAKIKPLLFVFLTILMTGFSGNTTAQDNIRVVQTIGTAVIHENDLASARNNALSAAMASSVQMVVAELISQETIISNFQKLDEFLFMDTENYIREYKVLNENTSGKTQRVFAETAVFTQKIKERLISLEIIETHTDLPKVVLLIAEQNIGDILPRFWWGDEPTFVKGYAERTIAEAFAEQGFSVLDHEGLILDTDSLHMEEPQAGTSADGGSKKPPAAGKKPANYFNTPYLTNEQAVELGRHLKADIVVVGTAIAGIVPNTMDETSKSVEAELSVEVLQVKTGVPVSSMDQQTVTVATDSRSGGRDALSNAGALAAENLVAQTAQFWKNSEKTSGQIEIRVKGTGELNDFVLFRKHLAEIPDVHNLQIKEVLPNQAILTVDFDKPAQALAESLMQISFDNFGINIFETENRHISLELLPAKNNP